MTNSKTFSQQLRSSIEAILATRASQSLEHIADDYACVSLLMRVEKNEVYLGFIRRAETPTDPWSGHLALPGGRREAKDPDDISAAKRETEEEIGFLIDDETLIGRLDDIQARKGGQLLPFYLRPFLFFGEGPEPKLNLDPREVDKFYWISLDYLLDAQNHVIFPWERGEVRVQLPGIRFPSGQILWGLTYMILTAFVYRLQEGDFHEQIPRFSAIADLSFWKKLPSQP